MQEQELLIASTRGVKLQARICTQPGKHCLVICHPHPKYGGNMHNQVVTSVRDVGVARGWSTIRFNFRGVGQSTGCFDEGLGEKDDLMHVVQYAQCIMPQVDISLVGYSFGAWVALAAISTGFEPQRLLLIAPALDFMDFEAWRMPACPAHVIVGDRDEYCSSSSLKTWVNKQSTQTGPIGCHCLPGADHFFSGMEPDLYELVRQVFES